MDLLLFKKKKINLVAYGARLQDVNIQKGIEVGGLIPEKQQ